MADADWVANAFPGDGLQVPTDVERDYADGMLAEWCTRWGEPVRTVARVHPETAERGLAGTPTNRAYLRSQIRRWWHVPPKPAQ